MCGLSLYTQFGANMADWDEIIIINMPGAYSTVYVIHDTIDSHLFIYLCRCGIRGGYMEMVGINKDVMDILEKYMSSKLCANTIGQVKSIPIMIRAATNAIWFW